MNQEGQPNPQVWSCCCRQGRSHNQFLIPVSFQVSSFEDKRTPIAQLDPEEDIRTKFQRYNPNLASLLSRGSESIRLQDQKSNVEKSATQANPVHDKVVSQSPEQQALEDKVFRLKHFEYMETTTSKCRCHKTKLTKLLWTPMYTGRNLINGFIRGGDKQATGNSKLQLPGPQPQIATITVQTQTENPKAPLPVGPTIQGGKTRKDSTPWGYPVPLPPGTMVQNPKQSVARGRWAGIGKEGSEVPKSASTLSIFKRRQMFQVVDSEQPCGCACHTKRRMAGQPVDHSQGRQHTGQELVGGEQSHLSMCRVQCGECRCQLRVKELPQYRLDPRNYLDLPAQQIREVPYAGKMSRYGLNVYCSN